ncbi:MAG: hypothetical protein AAB426_06935, partial [Myxococcota bacterium]
MSKLDGVKGSDPTTSLPREVTQSRLGASTATPRVQQRSSKALAHDTSERGGAGTVKTSELPAGSVVYTPLAARVMGNWAPVIEVATIAQMQPQEQPVVIGLAARDADGDARRALNFLEMAADL